MTTTMAQLIDSIVDPIPVIQRRAAQGDLLFRRLDRRPGSKGTPIPPAGLTVVEGNHNHVIVGAGTWHDDYKVCDATIGVLCNDEPVHVLHITQSQSLSGEHGAHILSPGVWEFRGQIESAKEGLVRRVLD